MATARVPNHAHCVQCGKAVTFGEQVCSDECQAQLDDAQKQRKKMMYIMYGLLAVAFLFLFLGPVFQQALG